MNNHALTLFALLALGCADDNSDDDVGDTSTTDDASTTGDTGESTSTSDTSTSDTSTSDTSTSDTSTSDTTSDTSTSDTTSDTSTSDTTSDTGEPIMCPDVFPEFDKTCGSESDCAVVVHTTDCCGNTVAWGLALTEVAAFEAAEAICDSQYPQCDCPSGPTVAEDGNPAINPEDILVACQMGSCMSYVPV